LSKIAALFYHLAIGMYVFLVKLAGLFSEKARQRANAQKEIDATLALIKKEDPLIWIHSASLGEFEQARPIVDRLRTSHPNHKILLTFFSPSGYLPRKHYANADFVTYLPFDTKKKATDFVAKVNPQLVVWIKYDFWFNFLDEIGKRDIPFILVAGRFRKEQLFFKNYGSFFAKKLNNFTHLFVQTQQSIDLLNDIGIDHCSYAPDTRFDRVYTIYKEQKDLPKIAAFKNDEALLVAGSTWQEGEKLLAQFYKEQQPNCKLLIVPHELGEAKLQRTLSLFGEQAKLFSQTDKEADLKEARILILDTMGMLSSAYRYGDIGYIGGGFGKGIHNLLEAVVYRIPVMIGPKHKKFEEANDLVAQQGVFVVNTVTEVAQVFAYLKDDKTLKRIKNIQEEYVASRLGGTDLVLDYIRLNLVDG